MRRVLASLGAVLLTAGLVSGCAGNAVEKKPADRLPDVTLQPLGDGQPVDLGKLRGPAVVNLWASWCPPCRKELPQYEAFAQKYAGKVDVLGVDYQETGPATARALAQKAGVRYPLVTDPDGKLHAVGLPKVILVDADGKITRQQYLKITSVAQLERLVRDHLGVRS